MWHGGGERVMELQALGVTTASPTPAVQPSKAIPSLLKPWKSSQKEEIFPSPPLLSPAGRCPVIKSH